MSGETAEVGVNAALGVRNEVGRLRTVHAAPAGQRARRLTPRNNDALLFDGLPWVDRAQEEHDAFADALRDRGVEVLYLSTLLVETLADPEARARAIELTLTDIRLGDALRRSWTPSSADLDAGRPGRGDDGRAAQRRGARHRQPGRRAAAARRLPDRPAAQPAVHPRLQRLGPGPGDDHLAGDAGPPAGDPADRADLRVPPAVRRGGADPRLGEGVPRGRRRAGPGRRGARRRRRRADPAVGRRAAGPDRLRPGPGPHGAGGADRPGPGDHAPGHHLHHGRRRRRGDVPERRPPAVGADRTRRGRAGRAGAGAAGAVPAPRPRGRWASTSSG